MKRTNGFTAPLHPLQVTTYVVFLLVHGFYFAVCIPALPTVASQAALGVFHSLVAVAVLYYGYVTTACNPIDDWVTDRSLEMSSGSQCHLCVQKVQPESKHCRLCDKCVDTFDHHCKWLNNCVGKKNYRSFLATLASTISMVLIEICVCVWLIHDIVARDATSESTVVFVLLCVFLSLDILFTGLLVHLFGFHMMIVYRGQTTYDYLVDVSRMKAERRMRRQNGLEDGRSSWFKMSLVRPVQGTPGNSSRFRRKRIHENLSLCCGANDPDDGEEPSVSGGEEEHHTLDEEPVYLDRNESEDSNLADKGNLNREAEGVDPSGDSLSLS